MNLKHQSTSYKASFVLCSVAILWVCACINCWAMMKMNFSPWIIVGKTLKDILVHTSQNSRELSFTYLHRIVLQNSGRASHLFVFACLRSSQNDWSSAPSTPNSHSDMKTHIRCFLLCITVRGTLRFIYTFSKLCSFRDFCLPLLKK